jgi:uncharacterized protein involved in exopolysaccharide biosynthesis
VAAGITLAVSLLLPKRYTATASLLIEAPGGNDARITTAVSPVYLESLKSYEHFAASDTLFHKALDRYHLRASEESSLEAMKRRVLRVSKLRDTRILQIAVTLPDPKTAQALAQFLAEETLNLNESLIGATGRELEAAAVTDHQAAKRDLEQLQKELADLTVRTPIERLQADLRTLTDLRWTVREQFLETEVDIAGDEPRQNDTPALKALAQTTRARAAALQKQSAQLEREIERKTAELARAQTQRQVFEAKIRAAQTAFDSASARLRDVRGSTQTRGERIRIVDPGVVPERPTFPNAPLNVLVALASAAVAALLYLGVTFQTQRSPFRATATHSHA